ncbi:hypothetical protein [uncultured Roseobacter sp.]|nr:hypothetical protein [uncultured Roseobacter sp.]
MSSYDHYTMMRLRLGRWADIENELRPKLQEVERSTIWQRFLKRLFG